MTEKYRARFVVHEHHALRLHFDFRLEIGDVLKSWAVPKGLSLNPADKRLAVAVPDHAVSYIDFEGTIAEGKYGAGRVAIWDNGEFETADEPNAALKKGKLTLTIFGAKLRGSFVLLKMRKRADEWLIIKNQDEFANARFKLETVLKTGDSTK